jgi:hypothetical protein
MSERRFPASGAMAGAAPVPDASESSGPSPDTLLEPARVYVEPASPHGIVNPDARLTVSWALRDLSFAGRAFGIQALTVRTQEGDRDIRVEINQHSGQEIAAMFGTTRGEVYS